MALSTNDCALCNHRPAAEVTFRGHRGFIIYTQFYSKQGPFCRDCGVATFRDLTSLTLAFGWWSLFSIFIAPVVLVRNLIGLTKVAKLAAPEGGSDFIAPNMRPLPPAKPVFARPLSWIVPAVLAVLVALALSYTPGPGTDPQLQGCLTRTRFGGDKLVSCTQRHQFRVTAVVSDWSMCPAGTQEHVELLGKFRCLVADPPR
ncbi:hypothetical protein Rhe02_12770 [Rhizocola hellebori]|uniref:Uncharacterized protein n=1 Tax=Rhizocola hellebori TaxID=1392758 RepID=A0A8J3Q3K1_9ACTN|nr:hypothetical protein [Rhizocola hellebori]GIH03210.1 hypothetical protein Rhe02_12770 [Rhizocola hellebori]